nr:hypothetical protein [Hydrogenophilus thermoluteolus]
MHRFETADDETGGDQAGERANFVRFVGVVHGEVGVVPVPEHPQADEVALLPFDLFCSEFAAQPAHFAAG